eukprot:5886000-Pleurochrysis_carterae.AAC.1
MLAAATRGARGRGGAHCGAFSLAAWHVHNVRIAAEDPQKADHTLLHFAECFVKSSRRCKASEVEFISSGVGLPS